MPSAQRNLKTPPIFSQVSQYVSQWPSTRRWLGKQHMCLEHEYRGGLRRRMSTNIRISPLTDDLPRYTASPERALRYYPNVHGRVADSRRTEKHTQSHPETTKDTTHTGADTGKHTDTQSERERQRDREKGTHMRICSEQDKEKGGPSHANGAPS